MPRRIIGSVVGALAAAALIAPVAHAAAPAKVSVRADAPGRTLVDAEIATTRQRVVKDGDAAHSCTGTSVAGALEQATAGGWDASWFDGLGYAVDAIRGVRAPADFSAYWTLWVNGRASTTGDAAHAPRLLRGIARDPEGAGVAFRLTRRTGGACTAFDGDKARFRPCGRRGAPLVDAGDGVRWSYLLPARLASGGYSLVVIATDDPGNRRILRVRFVVEG